jgi:peptidoglycan/LPS O-acetylase OafA/YrhL
MDVTALMRPTGTSLYRPDIDGLRAVSILVILACHLQIPGSSGGFIGVDTFFVISGYVIHQGLLRDSSQGRLSLGTFYWRRVRRIIPSLSVTVIASLVAGAFFLTPTQLIQTSDSSIAALFFYSNIFFNDTLGYFAPEARTMPLLHTWSLGVEEQFYIVVPLLFWIAAVRMKRVPISSIIIGVTLASFVWCQVESQIAPQKAFYLPMSRLWELGVGGLVAIAEQRGFSFGRWSGFAGLIGALLIALSLVVIDENTVFPGIAACLPIAGTALVILAGGRGVISAALSHPAATFVGKRSYTLYLVHWPVISFWTTMAGHITLVDTVLMLLLMAALCLALSEFVENPLRAIPSPRAPGGRQIAALFLLAACLAAAFSTLNGLPDRLPARALSAIEDLRASEANRLPCVPMRDGLAPKEKWPPCHFGEAGFVDVVIAGDSHAGAISSELAHELLALRGIREIALLPSNGCVPLYSVVATGSKTAGCELKNATAFQRIIDWHPRVVVLVARWAVFASEVRSPGDFGKSMSLHSVSGSKETVPFGVALTDTVRYFQSFGIKVLVVGSVPEIDFDVPDALTRKLWYGAEVRTTSFASFANRQQMVMEALDAMQRATGASVVYPHRTLCDNAHCRAIANERALYIDDDHLSPLGAQLVAPVIARQVDLMLVTGR